jgi:hypothetical protein
MLVRMGDIVSVDVAKTCERTLEEEEKEEDGYERRRGGLSASVTLDLSAADLQRTSVLEDFNGSLWCAGGEYEEKERKEREMRDCLINNMIDSP